MRSLFLMALAVSPMFSVAQTQKPNFTVNGSVKNLAYPVSKVYLNYTADGTRVTDSATVADNKFVFKGTISEPVLAMLRVKYADNTVLLNQNRDNVTFFLDKGAITFQAVDSFSNVTVKGSKANVEYEKITKEMKPHSLKMDGLNIQYRKMMEENDEAGVEKLREEAGVVMEAMNGIYKNYAAKNPKSPLALYAIGQYADRNMNVAEVEGLFNALPVEAKLSKSGKALEGRIAAEKKTAIGVEAMDFTQNDTLGNPVSLSSFRGQYVLIDFWASWCGPCRAENPNLVEAFHKFKDKGFTVLGVSLDQGTPDKWIEAIHKDNLTWTQLSDLQGWKNAVATQYGVRSIPQSYLIDPKGVIVAKNLRGEALHKKLEELLP